MVVYRFGRVIFDKLVEEEDDDSMSDENVVGFGRFGKSDGLCHLKRG